MARHLFFALTLIGIGVLITPRQKQCPTRRNMRIKPQIAWADVPSTVVR
jgi:hypothetical protein